MVPFPTKILFVMIRLRPKEMGGKLSSGTHIGDNMII